MRALVAVGVLVVAGCGGSAPSPESVVRAWTQAVNSGDDVAAARLFADGARVVERDRVRQLRTFEQARAWNAGLRCARRILELRTRGESVRATFVLRNRDGRACDAPGERAHALVNVREGKIVLWHRLDPLLEPHEEPA